ncbi:nuclease homologue [Thermanaeromonas toyohensis ToBE]|uniref:Nuclease homologue n=1 Tax=Thermanaeromonas toyohensis ToBE TaxID=698762 RepID=A0A1W1VAL3_9FIRM|nr:thermonuclease family protein [Thermanaeromonas toyohensis]SMB90253.1 nuclease homologue [Thermanaeromonas toyohensis ToBE]
MNIKRRLKGKSIIPWLFLTFLTLLAYNLFPRDRGIAGLLLEGKVHQVIDGDTIMVILADGREEKVRFIGVNTPEISGQVQPYGLEAKAYTKKRLDGRRIYLELDTAERDKYGRLLAYVWLERPQNKSLPEIRAKMFNAELLLEGYAQVMTVPPNVKYAEIFKQLEKEARNARKGLWGL